METQSDLDPSSRELLKAAVKIKRDRTLRNSGLNTNISLGFTRKDLEKQLGWERYRVGRAIEPLEKAGYFSMNTYRKPFYYELAWDDESNEADLRGVLTPDDMKVRIAENLDSIDNVYMINNPVALVA